MPTPNTHFGPDALREMLSPINAIYFLGIGGVSMSSLAVLTKGQGLCVGGYDRTASPLTRKLEASGIRIDYTPDASHLDGYGAVVYTVAIAPDQPEYLEAIRRGIPLISRADYLGYLMSDYGERIGFAGTHGKSTCTCMCAQLFMDAGMDPTVLSGASMPTLDGTFRAGARDYMIIEACEYMDSFLDFRPSVAVVLNTEWDHVDYFHSLEQLRDSFAAYASLVGRQGLAIYNADDPQTVQAMESVNARLVSFGRFTPSADFSSVNERMENGYARFTLMFRGKPLTEITLRIPGEHNIYNALATAAVARCCGLCSRTIAEGIHNFTGADRRMQYKGRLNGAAVYDDYAHHPTEVAATVREAALLGGGRLICVFQPHTYSRTATLFDRYVEALSPADTVILAPIYAARETDDRRVNSARLARAVGGNAVALGGLPDIAAHLTAIVQPGDTVVIMGAGNIDALYPLLPLTP